VRFRISVSFSSICSLQEIISEAPRLFFQRSAQFFLSSPEAPSHPNAYVYNAYITVYFLQDCTGSSDIRDHISFVRNINKVVDDTIRIVLKNTLIMSEAWIAFAHLVVNNRPFRSIDTSALSQAMDQRLTARQRVESMVPIWAVLFKRLRE